MTAAGAYFASPPQLLNQLATVTGGTSGNNSFLYDADGNLLIQREPGKTTLYLPDQQLTLDTTTNTITGARHIALPGGGTAIRTGSGTNYTFALMDHQGTPTLYLDNTAQIPTWRQYTPYGGPRGTTPTTPDNRGFLNKPTSPTGLTLVGARAYDPTIGRFISLDPLQDTGQPQQWNGYSYANNTPVTTSDPTGLIPEDCLSHTDCYGYSPSALTSNGGGCKHGCGTTKNQEWGKKNGRTGTKAKPGKYVPKPKPKPKPKRCGGGWLSSACNWVADHKEDLAGVALGVVVGLGCTAITGGAGVVFCGAIGGALSSGSTGLLKGQRGTDLALTIGTGALFGAAGGALGSVLGAGAAAAGSGVKAAGSAMWASAKGLGPGIRESAAAFSRANFSEFVSVSRYHIAVEAMSLGSQEKPQLAIATDLIMGGLSVRNGIVPGLVAGAAPGNWNDVNEIRSEGWKFKPENMIGPMSGGGSN